MGDSFDIILEAGPAYSVWYGGVYSTDERSTYYRMAMWGEGEEDDTDDTDAGIAQWGALDISRPSSINVGQSMAWGGWFLVEKLQSGNIILIVSPKASVYESD